MSDNGYHDNYTDDTQLHSENREYYWILAVDSATGRPVILGPFDDEASANQVGFQKINGTFDVYGLPTRDPARATKALKYKRFHQTEQLAEALKRAKHTV